MISPHEGQLISISPSALPQPQVREAEALFEHGIDGRCEGSSLYQAPPPPATHTHRAEALPQEAGQEPWAVSAPALT